VDFARKRPKRDGEPVLRVSLDKAEQVPASVDPDILALDEALVELADFDPRKARIVELQVLRRPVSGRNGRGDRRGPDYRYEGVAKGEGLALSATKPESQ
jgi:hypothetical protein